MAKDKRDGFEAGNKDRGKRGGSSHEIERDNGTPKGKPLPKDVEGHKLGKGAGRKSK